MRVTADNVDKNPISKPDQVIHNAVIALSLAAFGSGIAQRLSDPLLPRFADEFEVTLGVASWVITAFTISYAVCQLLFGPVGDAFGKYRVIAWSCIASSCASLLCALAPGFGWLIAARVLAGGMVAGLIPLAMAWIGDVVPYEQRQPVLARFLIGHLLGVSAGQLLGGLSADYLGWRMPFFVLSIVFMAGALILLSVRRGLPTHALATHTPQGHALSHVFQEFSQVLAQPWARVILLTVFIEGAFVFGAFAFFAAHLHTALNISLTAAGATVMLFGFGGLLFATTSRKLVTRLGEVGLARVGTLLMLLSLGVIALAINPWLAAPACFVFGLGFYMLHNTLQTNATQMAPERRGAAVSAFAACFFMGQSVGVAVAGWLVGRIGSIGILLGAALGVLLVGMEFARRRRALTPGM